MTPTASDLASLLRAILEDPDCDGTRLVYADCLEDAGDTAQADFIRDSMRLAKGWEEKSEKCSWGGTCGCDWHEASRVLPTKIHAAWRGTVGMLGFQFWYEPPGDITESLLPATRFGFWRGLPEVWCVADVPTFEREAAGVFALHPIRRVVLRCEVGLYIWNYHGLEDNANPDDVTDPELFATLSGVKADWAHRPRRLYDSPVHARADLEAKAVAWGRSLAGLPALGEPDG